MGAASSGNACPCAGRVLLAGRFVRVTSANAHRKLFRAVVARLLGRRGAGQIANDPFSYETRIRAAVPAFDAFQDTVAEATRGLDARLVLDLGIGTGETARRVLELHPVASRRN